MSSTSNLLLSPPTTPDHLTSPRTVRKQELEAEVAEQAHDVNDGDNAEGEGDDNDDNDDAQSVVSQTSTVEYEHEPFCTFQEKARNLAASLFNVTPSDIIVEHIKGGSYNRIVGLTIAAAQPKKWSLKWVRQLLSRSLCLGRAKVKKAKKQEYVLRVPRFETEGYGLDYDIAILRFACKTLNIPIPELVFHDTSSDNAIGSPYMIQKRLLGQNLAHGKTMENLNTSQMQDLTRQLLSMQQQMQALTSSSGGVIAPSDFINDDPLIPTRLETFPVPPPPKLYGIPPTPLFAPSAPQSTYDFLITQCNRWIQWEEAEDGFSMPHWSTLRIIIDALNDRGFLPSTSKFHLCHSDIFARNILIDTPTPSTVNITGLLDWDAEFVHFAPFFTAYRAPFWLWITDDNDESEIDERAVFSPSTDAKDIEVRKVWEEMAGQEWKTVAMQKEYVVARRLWNFLRGGIWSSDMTEQAEGLVQDWLEVYPEDVWRFPKEDEDEGEHGGVHVEKGSKLGGLGKSRSGSSSSIHSNSDSSSSSDSSDEGFDAGKSN